PPDQKQLLQRASVIGRVFWHGALEQLAPGLDADALLDALIDRELVLAEERSTIAGERAFRFKHILIAEAAYEGGRQGGGAERRELMEIRAYHLRRAVCLREELEGAAPEELRLRAATALEGAGKRALNREAFQTARSQIARALEREPTLRRRYLAALAAWR